MRSIHKVLIIVIFLSAISCICVSQNKSIRKEENLNEEWRFIKSDQTAAESVNLNDSQWESVTLPHTWNTLDGQDGGSNYYRGIGWYRKHFFVDKQNQGKNLYLQFDGASIVTTVFLNGKMVGVHKGAFGRFRMDITNLVKFGTDNVLAVKVNNASDANVAPKGGDFTICGGLYRDVNLLITDKLHITTADYGSPGVYITPSNVSEKSADISIRTTVVNDDNAARRVKINTIITDSLGKLVKAISTDRVIPKNGQYVFNQKLGVLNPHLWNGENDPYLYQVTVDISLNGKLLDRVKQDFGLRTLEFNPNKGFILNGSKYLIKGVSLHQDKLNKGWALTNADQDESMSLIKEMGGNGIRCHYQMSPYWYDLCQKNGTLVWGEIPVYQYENYTPAFVTNIKDQLRELIRQNYNNPSFIVWSIGNECGDNEKMYELFAELNTMVKNEDPNRFTTYANNRPHTPQEMVNYTDVPAYNWYCGWYINEYNKYGPVEHLDDIIKDFRKTYPNKPIGISEYGAGGSIVQHEENPAPPDPLGYWHPEEYQSLVHEKYWAQVSKYDFFWGTFIWCMFDFASDSRKDGDVIGRNDKGMVSAGREYKKDVFYFYKANWTTTPFTYITSRRATNRSNANTYVKVYANCEAVELFIDGKTAGRLVSPDKIYVWKNLTIPNGAKVTAIGKYKGKDYKDEIVWNNDRKL